MIQEFQKLFVSPKTKTSLEFRGTVNVDGRWQDGVLEGQDGSVFPVRCGIPNFVGTAKQSWSGGGESASPEIGWIERSWREQIHKVAEYRNHEYYRFAREIAEFRGLGIDIASGPGGGAVPAILYFDPDARIMMTDLGVDVLNLWMQHLYNLRESCNVSFAGMDVTSIPLKVASLDYVVDSGGFGNVNHTDLAIEEAFRVLKPGGHLYLNEAITEGLEEFPAHIYAELVEYKPQERVGWAKIVEDVGFLIRLTNTWARREMDYDESELGALARTYDVKVSFTGFSLIADKP